MNDTGAKIVNALESIFSGEELKAEANLNNYLNSAAGIGEHPDITDAMQVELDAIARYHDQLEVLKNYVK